MLKLLEFPKLSATTVVDGLRALADSIERGGCGDAHNIAWVCDGGNGEIHIGLLGQCAEPGPTAYFLYGVAQRKLEGS